MYLQGGDLTGALDVLLGLEKKTRIANDAPATSRVALEIVRACWEARDIVQLNAHVLILAKRRSQLKQVITDVVKEAMGYTELVADKADRTALVSTLRTVADGKMYLEVRRAAVRSTHVHARCRPGARGRHLLRPLPTLPLAQVERARLTLQLARMQEAEGKVAEAADTLQEIAVETFSSMEKREKAEILLEQVRRGQGR